jgi:thymidine kinase
MTQQDALDILKLGGNVFLTGSAGSGKTFVLNQYIDYLKKHNVPMAITASTGIAATHLGGVTIHSWSGLGIKDSLTDSDIESLLEKEYLFNRQKKTKVLIIDEISMLSSNQLTMIEWICRSFKGNDKPFGGMQVIFCGDFFQLPPISRFGDEVSFAYQSEVWESLNINICYLSENHRHEEKDFLSFLNKIRNNKIDSGVFELLESRKVKNKTVGESITRLFSHNVDVDRINNEELSKIKGESKVFKMISKGKEFLVETLKKSCLSPETLELKIGAKVMFVKNNYEAGFVNGTIGKISGFNSFGEPIVRTNNGKTIPVALSEWRIEEDGKVLASISQFPLRLAWAITVHKSQGMSLDEVELDLSSAFVSGMGYVALSRVRSIQGLTVLGFNQKSLEVNNDVLEKDFFFQEQSQKAELYLKNLGKKEKERIQKNFIDSISEVTKVKEVKESTAEKTLRLLKEKKSLKEIADQRGVKQETIVSHIEELLEAGEKIDLSFLKKEFKRDEFEEIFDTFEEVGETTLTPVYNLLQKRKKKPSYLKLRIVRLFL